MGRTAVDPGPAPHQTLVFSDLSRDPSGVIVDLFRSCASSQTLRRILDGCTQAVRVQLESLDHEDRERIPHFASFADLTRLADSGAATDIVSTTLLTTIAQFGCLALLVEQDPRLLGEKNSKTCSVGLCTGVLAALAVAAASSTDDLVHLAQQLVAVAFRLGLAADRRSRAIDSSQESWSFAAFGVSFDEAVQSLDVFNRERKIPTHRKAYVSARLPASVTISGPPSTLDLVTEENDLFKSAKKKALPITSAFHAEHLSCPDIDQIIGSADVDHYELDDNSSVAFLDTKDRRLRPALQELIYKCFQTRIALINQTIPSSLSATAQATRIISVEPAGSCAAIKKWLGDDDDNIEHAVAGGFVPDEDVPTKADDSIAIIGMAGRFPESDTLEEFWEVVKSGKDVHQRIPMERFDVNACYDKSATAKNSTASPYGCFMKQPGAFDNVFFNMSPREARQIDPQQRLLMMVTQEALQMAGYSSAGNMRIGTFFGQATDDWRESHTRQDIDIFYVGGGMRAFAPGRLNYHYKWEGPSYSVDAACSASLAALEMAFKAVQSGDCDMAVAGGGNLISALPMFSGLSKGHFTSSTGSCKTFDVDADGYCRGEAVGVVIIKRLKDARRDNDNVKGIVAGISTNHSAKATSITHPHAETQVALMHRTLDSAGLEPCDIDYVEFHGTGTKAGDRAEITSVSSVFGQDPQRESPLHIGAVKSNVGHGEAAAGITSLIKALLMLQFDTIPPHCGIKTEFNPALKEIMDESIVIPREATPFYLKESPKNILINNFNATGGNTSMILQEAPSFEKTTTLDPRSHHIVALSAQTAKSLESNATNLDRYLADTQHFALQDVAYSTSARRLHHKHRLAFVAADAASLQSQIAKRLEEGLGKAAPTAPRVAFVFAGQGTQTQGVAKELFETSPSFKVTILGYEKICTDLGFPSFVPFLVDPEATTEWSPVQLQLATIAVELALARLWQSWGIKPAIVVGHSIGEYAALCVAGVLSTIDLFTLVGTRAQLMQDLCKDGTHSMLAVQQPPEEFESLKSEHSLSDCEISCYNSQKAITVSGPLPRLEQLKGQLGEKSVKSKLLNVKYAFHSANMDPILEKFRAFAESIPFKEPQISVVSTLLGREVAEADVFTAQYLTDHCRSPVQFTGAMRDCTVEVPGRTVWIEFGPGDPSCLPLIKSGVAEEHRSGLLSSLSTRNGIWENISSSLAQAYEAGLDVDWKGFHQDFAGNLTLVDMPQYAFDLQDFWIPLESNGEVERSATQQQEKLSPILHFVDQYSQTAEGATAQFHSSLSDAYLFTAISGHFVLGSPLCPSSIYSAIAMKAVSYLQSRAAPTTGKPLERELGSMEIRRPLIVHEGSDLQLRVSAVETSDSAKVSFATTEGGKDIEHGRCAVQKVDASQWQSDWSRIEFFVSSRMDTLDKSSDPAIMRLPKSVLYKLFSHVVEYSEPFRGIQQITLDNAHNEAVADVQFAPSAEADSEYDLHFIDSLMHFAGFVLNNGIDDESSAFISDGWESLRIPAGLSRTGRYQFYVRLNADDKNQVFSGDVYVFADKRIVACCNGVRFQRMKMQTLRSVLKRPVSDKQQQQPPQQADKRPPAPPSRASSSGKQQQERDVQEDDKPTSLAKIKCIVAQESGVSESSISNESNLAELGLDSILMTTVVERIADQTGIEVPSGESSGAQTYGELMDIISAHDTSKEHPASSPTGLAHLQVPGQDDSAASSPTTKDSGYHSDGGDGNVRHTLDVLIAAIAKQAGVGPEEVEQASDFGALGVDSLLGLDIMDAVAKELGRDLPGSLLHDNPSVEKLEAALSGKKSGSTSRRASAQRHSGSSTPRSGTPRLSKSPSAHKLTAQLAGVQSTKKTSPERSEAGSSRGTSPRTRQQASRQGNAPASAPPASDGGPKATWSNYSSKARLIHGHDDGHAAALFLLPPGPGQAAIYSVLPQHPQGMPVYGLTSPFAAEPESRHHTFANCAQAYRDQIVRLRPRGPYHVAGYSLGGVYAYEVCWQLLQEERQVASLIIIDCPAPEPPLGGKLRLGLEALDMAGYAKHVQTYWPNFPASLQRHMAAAVQAFNNYEPVPFAAGRRPGYVCVVWASRGNQALLLHKCVEAQQALDRCAVGEKAALQAQRRETADMSWVSQPRTSFGPNGWEQWLGSNVEYEALEGDHNSIMVQPGVQAMAQRLFGALKRSEAKQGV